jgi:hypothetical protein
VPIVRSSPPADQSPSLLNFAQTDARKHNRLHSSLTLVVPTNAGGQKCLCSRLFAHRVYASELRIARVGDTPNWRVASSSKSRSPSVESPVSASDRDLLDAPPRGRFGQRSRASATRTAIAA